MHLGISKDIVAVTVGDKLIIGTKNCLRLRPVSNSGNSASSNESWKSVVVVNHENWKAATSEEPEEFRENSSEFLKISSEEKEKAPKISTPHNVGLAANRPDIENTRWFSAVAVSSKGNYVAAADNLKTLFVYRVKDERGLLIQAPVLISSQTLAKRSMALTFTEDERTVVVADKLGDAYTFETDAKSRSKPLLPILGHISVITDVVLSPDEKFILTGDRDEKIRVSHFPLADDIQSFCLGHTKFVTRLLIPTPAHPVVISGSGDSSIRAFNYLTGEELGTVFCLESEASPQTDSQISAHVVAMAFHSGTQTLLASLNGKNVILTYKIEFTAKENGQIERVTFVPSVNLQQSASIISMALLEDSLVILQSHSERPLVCVHDLSRVLRSGGGDSDRQTKTEASSTELEEAIVSCLKEISNVPGGLECVLRDPFADLFSPSSRPVAEEMTEFSAEVEDSKKKKEESGISAKKKKKSSETIDAEPVTNLSS